MAAGVLDLPKVELPYDCEAVDDAIRKGLDGIRLLFACRAAITPGVPICLARPFLSDWAGISDYDARRTLLYAVEHDLIRKAGETRAGRGTAFLYELGGQS